MSLVTNPAKWRKKLKPYTSLTGCRILVTEGENAGKEGVALGPGTSGRHWMVSIDGESQIRELQYPDDFSMLFDASGRKELN